MRSIKKWKITRYVFLGTQANRIIPFTELYWITGFNSLIMSTLSE